MKSGRIAWVCLPAIPILLGGCRHGEDWFPMAVGKSWNYRVQSGFDERDEAVRVEKSLSVASVQGYELSGPLGRSRVAWKDGRLLASSTVNATFLPPAPLLYPEGEIGREKPARVAVWHGRLVVAGKEHPASAVLEQKHEELDLGSRKVPTLLATLTVTVPAGKIELDTWYQQGVGIVQQEQRTNGVRLVQLQLRGRS